MRFYLKYKGIDGKMERCKVERKMDIAREISTLPISCFKDGSITKQCNDAIITKISGRYVRCIRKVSVGPRPFSM
jgi:hypothetical protein